MPVLIIAPHPDDEVLGCGGTIAKLAEEGHDVYVLIATKAGPPLFTEEFVKKGREEAKAAHVLLGVKETFYSDLPAASLDMTEHGKVNQALCKIIDNIKPELLFIPFVGDLHLDHQSIFTSALVASRPNQANFPKKILAYETLSETYWNAAYITPGFHPNVFIDISAYLEKKLRAFACYQSQVKAFPHERSLQALQALAQLRGANVFKPAAEAFVLIREII